MLLLGAGLLLVQPAHAMTASLNGLGLALFIIGLVLPVAIALVVSTVAPALRPQLPRRLVSTLLLTTAIWLGSLRVLYGYKHEGPQPSTTDW